MGCATAAQGGYEDNYCTWVKSDLRSARALPPRILLIRSHFRLSPIRVRALEII
jgi:hypothetical protein